MCEIVCRGDRCADGAPAGGFGGFPTWYNRRTGARLEGMQDKRGLLKMLDEKS